jgi:hypothetical protein
MGMFDKLRGKSDGPAYMPGRGGLEPMMKNGRPVMMSELTKEQRKSIGMAGATKPAPRSERKKRKEWGR